MLNIVDYYLNRITMYKLVLYYLIVLLVVAGVVSIFNLVPYSIVDIAVSTLFITGVCLLTNTVFAKVFNVTPNSESVYITALIIALIFSPFKSMSGLPLLFWASVLSMAAKYMFAINRKHIFNPAAIAAVMVAFGLNQAASWWVGNLVLTPFVLVGGLLVVRKIQRGDLVFSFFISAIIFAGLFGIAKGGDLFATYRNMLFHSSLLFFAFVMLTEPLTTPPTKKLQIIYGALTGFLFLPQIHIGSIYSTPELALLVGNVFSYIVSPKAKLFLKLKEKLQLSPDTMDFVFPLEKKLAFTPGQYMEWTVPHEKVDSRGNRRYFTLASSPTEDTVRIGVKFYEPKSSYKQALSTIDGKTEVAAAQIAGDFTLLNDPSKKYVLIAGGIGVTPYRSMIKYMIDTNKKKDVVLIYSNKLASDIVYKDVFDEAQQKLGIKTIYTLTDVNNIPPNWTGQRGRISADMIQKEIPDYKDRIFYLSGPHSMVNRFEETLKTMGISSNKIKKDFFPGFV